MAYMNPKFKEHVASLCGTDIGDMMPRPMGTCFFVQVANSSGREFDYLVTARHVYEEMRNAGGQAYLRINKGKVGEFEKGVIDVPIPLKAGWLFHPNKAVDLAVLPKEVIRDSGEMATLVEMEPHFGRPSQQEPYRFLFLRLESLTRAAGMGFPWPPIEGESVMFIAMTTQFQGERSNLPTLRRGHLSLVPKEHLKGKYGRSRYYVVEAQVYPGNSGAPVWVEIEDSKTRKGFWFTLGVLVFSYPTEEELKKVQGRTNVYYNLGLSLVAPIEEVVEILDSPDEKVRRERIRGPHLPGVAVSGSDDVEPFSAQK